MSKENDNTLNNFRSYIDKESISKQQDIEKNHIVLVDKGLDVRSYVRNSLSKHMSQYRLLASESSLS